MRELSANIRRAINGGNFEVFILLKLLNYSNVPVVISTSLYRDITMSDGLVYVSDSRIVSADPPKQSTVIDRELYKIVLDNTDFSLSALPEERLTGNLITVRAGFFDPDTGLPFTGLVDTLVLYRGKVESAALAFELQESGTALMLLNCSNPMMNLDKKSGLYLNKNQTRSRRENDSSCDYISESSMAITVRWGKQ